ncbi:MAG: ABC transporter permease [Deltaproteobacteria bacterium]|nr:ABC transporter permease [Deltaproteobacteria bacterium]
MSARPPTPPASTLATTTGSLARLVEEARHVPMRAVVRRLDEVVWGSLVLVVAAAGCVGAAMADQAGRQAMRLIGDQSFIGLEYPVLGVQEFCPLVTALVLAQRVGAGFAAELASLVVDGTLDALRLFHARPTARRIAPMALALPPGSVVLGVIAVVVWELAGIVAMFARSQVNPFTFFHPEAVSKPMLVELVGKCALFGACVFVGATTAALRARNHGDVGRATTDAVVVGTLLCLLVNVVVDVAWLVA